MKASSGNAYNLKGFHTDVDSFLRHLAGKTFKKVGIVSASDDDAKRLADFFRERGDATVAFSAVLEERDADIGHLSLEQVDQLVCAVFNSSVYRLRFRFLQRLRALNQNETEILSPIYAYNPFHDDPLFHRIASNLADKSSWGFDFWQSWKAYGVYQLLRTALPLKGDCIEFGCYRGYSASFLAETAEVFGLRKKIFIFDTFSGMPHSDPRADSHYRQGDFADTSLAEVRKVLEPWADRIDFIEGDICETLSTFAPRDLCYVRIDVDLYAPAKAALEKTWDRIVPGGIVYLDDYVSDRTVGERIAVDEFLSDKKEKPFYLIGDRVYLVKEVIG